MGAHTERSTLAACVASLLAVPADQVPLDGDERRAWLAERGLGLVPIADPVRFAWAGPWIALRPARTDGGARAVVMFGVPSGPLWDPGDTTDVVLTGFLLAPLDVAGWTAPPRGPAGEGVVEAIVLAPTAEAATVAVPAADAVADLGLRGDRYHAGAGTFASGRPGSALTLVDADVIDELAAERGAPVDHRRNVVVRGMDLDALIGRRFRIGTVICAGRRACEPCAHLDRLNGGGVLRPLVHRGGLRADIVVGGPVRVGDAVSADVPPQ